jgi:hypothetical protein
VRPPPEIETQVPRGGGSARGEEITCAGVASSRAESRGEERAGAVF